jgi:hypothetical protein
VVRGAGHEPEAAAVRAHNEELRRNGYREFVEHLHERFGLRPGLDIHHATDALLTIAGQGVYRTLVVEYGWSAPRYLEWLVSTLDDVLLARQA